MEKKNHIQIVVVNDQRFAVEERNGNISFNLTQMAKPFGKAKQPSNWFRTEESERYLEALSDTQMCGSADLVDIRKGGVPENQGTWATDYRVAMRFAQWLDMDFAIAVDELAYKLLTQQATMAEPFNGVEPIIYNGKPWYNYMAVLRSLNYSLRSGTANLRRRQFPQHFIKLYGRNFVSLDFCEFLKNSRAAKQFVLDFKKQYKALKGGQL